MANNLNQNSSTITGDIKSRIDKIWDTLWAGGITVPVTILEQLTYLFFIKLLDDKQRHEESNAIEFGYELENPLFKKGEKWLNPETNQEVAYEDLRWSVFKGFSAQNMLHHVRNNVFVFSMPAGVFQPYSGVSTAILVFTKTDAGGTDNVWFYEMRADGFTLNAKRTPTNEDDIPDLLQRWQNLEAEASRTRKDQSFFVPVDEIRKNDYDLTFNKYKEVIREKVVYDDPKDVFARIEALEAQFAAKQKEFKEKYL